MQKIDIIHEPTNSEPFVIINKPSGMPSAPLDASDTDNALCHAAKCFPEILSVNGIKNIEYVFDNGQHDEYAWGRNYEKCLEFFGWIAEVK